MLSAAETVLEQERRSVLALCGEAKSLALQRKATVDVQWLTSNVAEWLRQKGGDNWHSAFAPIIEAIVEEQGQVSAAGLGIAFDVRNPYTGVFVGDLMDHFTRDVTQSTKDAISTELRAGVEAGEGLGQLTQRIERYYQGNMAYRAELTARTESLNAANVGACVAYQEAGCEEWEWLATGDERTCDICGPLNGHRYPISQPFEAKHPQCRCCSLPVVEERVEPEPEEAPAPSQPQYPEHLVDLMESTPHRLTGLVSDENAGHEYIQRHPEARTLAGALSTWGGNGDDAGGIRLAAESLLQKKKIGAYSRAYYFQEQAAEMVNAARQMPPNPSTLWRGDMLRTTSDNPASRAKWLAKNMQIGQDIDLGLVSTSYDESVARQFNRPGNLMQTQIVYQIRPGARGLPTGLFSAHRDEVEVVVSGRFKVVEVRDVAGKPIEAVLEPTGVFDEVKISA